MVRGPIVDRSQFSKVAITQGCLADLEKTQKEPNNKEHPMMFAFDEADIDLQMIQPRKRRVRPCLKV